MEEKTQDIILSIIAIIIFLVFGFGLIFIGKTEFEYQQKETAEFNNWYNLYGNKEIRITIIKKYTSENEYTGVVGGINAGIVAEKGKITTNKMYYLVDENYNDHLASMDVYNKVDNGVYLVNRNLICRDRDISNCYYIINKVIKKIK